MQSRNMWSALIFCAVVSLGCSLVACGDEDVPVNPAADTTEDRGTPDNGRSDLPPDMGREEVGPDCGNGTREGSEECDDGQLNGNTPNGCRDNCTLPFCGDGVVDDQAPYNEECDDTSEGCAVNCSLAIAELCDSCTADADCGGSGNACMVLDDGNFCGTACDSVCPDGFACQEIQTVAGATSRQCVPATGVCSGCFDPDRDGYGAGPDCTDTDCDQSNGEINPGADEVCDGVDNNCDGNIDEDTETTDYYPDVDRDGHGDEEGTVVSACVAPEGMVESNDDCNDADAFVHPGAAELCDDLDNDCDDLAETEDVDFDWYPDEDGDGFGDLLATAVVDCNLVEGHVIDNTDCNDGNALTNPDAAEVCDDFDDNNCDLSFDCDDSTCSADPVCNSDCEDSGLEPNDEAENAIPVSPGDYAGQFACPENADFYSLHLNAGDTLTIDATFAHAEGDIDIILFDGFGGILDGAESEDDNESLTVAAPISGTFVILVYLFEDAGETTGNDYDLTIAVDLAEVTCHDDGFEENDGGESASDVDAGTYENLVACDLDADFFNVAVGVGDQITIDATFTHEDGNINLFLLDAEGSLLESSETEDDDEQIVYTAPEASVVSIVLFLDSAEPDPDGSGYTLTIAIEPGATECSDDGSEPNDVAENASAVGAGDFTELQACPNDADYYSVALNAGDELVVDLTFLHEDGNIDVNLSNPEGEIVANSDSLTDNERIVFVALMSGDFVLHVSSMELPEAGAGYQMTIGINPVVDPECTPDPFEENDTIEDAALIEESTLEGLTACDGDLDLYSIALGIGDVVTVDLTFSHAEGDIDLAFADAEGTIIDVGDSVDDDESVIFEVEESGLYLIAVVLAEELGDDPGNTYDLAVDVEPGVVECAADEFEENDAFETPADLEAGSHTGLTSCEGDADFYAIDLDVGDEITVALTFTHADGDVDVYLGDAEGTVLASSTSEDDDESFTYTAEEAGQYIVLVNLWEDLGDNPGNAYSMDVDVEGAAGGCVDDEQEDNDSIDTAWPVFNESISAVSCDLDDDYYSIFLAEGDTLEVELTFSHADGDVDVILLDSSEAMVAVSESEDDNEDFEYTATATGEYFIVVYLFEDAGDLGADYGMDVGVAVPAVTCDSDDRFEDNDDPEEAEFLVEGVAAGLISCGLDSDFFEVLLFNDETLTLDLMFTHADADLDVLLYRSSTCDADGCGTELAEGISEDDNEQIIFTAEDFGLYMIEVYNADGEGGAEYDLSIDFSEE